VDVTRIIADKYQELGEAKVKAYFPEDYVHTNLAGADFNAAAVVSGLRGLKKSQWDEFLNAKGRETPPDQIGWLNLPEPANPGLPTLFLIGDSTVRNGRGDGGDGQWGWGDPILEYFDLERINVVNRAIGGLSSRTFLTQGHWKRVLMLAKPGDFVLMQFGHNDNGPLNDASRARGTIKGVGEETEEIDNQLTHQHEIVHTYGWYLRQYVREARERGLIPIVLSPVPRKEWANGKILRPKDSYPQWAKRVAEQDSVGFVDLYDRIAQYYDALGTAKVDALFADPHTHTSRLGAEVNANVVIEGLRDLPGAPLTKFMR
jgi:lysophospholipase L1-like esterase